MSQPVAANQRFSRANLCPICNGWPGSNPGCKGYEGDNPDYVYCTSSADAGSLPRMGEGRYRHKMSGLCNCGITHGNVLNFNPPKAQPMQAEVRKTLEDTFDYGDGCYVDRFALDTVKKNGKQAKDHVQYQIINGARVYKGFKKLYRIADVKDTEPSEPVFVAEGERKVNKLWELGYASCCNVGGSNGWIDAYSDELVGRTVLIWPDNDEDGSKFAIAVGKSLASRGIKYHTLNKLTIGLPDTGDVMDWVKLPGNDAARLGEVVKEYLPEPKKLFWKLSELKEYPKPKWLIAGVIKHNTLAFLVGPPKCGKSFYALDLALQVAAGGGNVLYIAAEDPADYYQRSLAWCEYNRVDSSIINDHIIFYPEPIQLHDDERRMEFTKALKLELAPQLIVVDTLAMNSLGLDENSQRDMGIFINALLQLRFETSACILTVHHTNRNGQYRGSSVIPGSADTFIMATQEGDKLWKGGQLKIVFEMQKNSKPVHDMYYRAEVVGDTLVLVDTATVNRSFSASLLTDLDKEILKTLAGPEAEKGMSVASIIKYAGWGKEDESKRTASYRNCKELAAQGYLLCINVSLKSSSRVMYQITPKGRDIVTQSDYGF